MYPKKVEWEWADSPNYEDCRKQFTQEIKKRAEELERYFEKLRFDETNHLGMGDIRLTRGQQDKMIKHITEGLEEEK